MQKQKTIIALRAKADSGKTTTIAYAYRILADQHKLIFRGNGRKEINGDILEIDGVKVGFASKGDMDWLLEQEFTPLIEKGCMVIVCAARSAGNTNRFVEGFSDFDVVWIEKVRRDSERERDIVNRRQANEIIEEVIKAVENANVVAT